MIRQRLAALGYDLQPAARRLPGLPIHSAVRFGDLVFTSGQVPLLGDLRIKGHVGSDVDLPTARRAAEICAVNCLRAVAAVAELESIRQIVKVVGMVNVAPGFDDTPTVIHGCSELLEKVLGERGHHARTAVGMVIPDGWAVEVDMVVAVG